MKKAFLVIMIVLGTVIMFGEEQRGLKNTIQKLDQNAGVGKQYAVLIGINKYKYWMPLKNPVKDVKDIKEILQSDYYIDQFFELYDEQATKVSILTLFQDLINTVKVDDSVFIFYAGHGHLDNLTNSGFWIPVDGGVNQLAQENWIGNSSIRGLIGNIKSKHVLLISDSCFSGDLLNAHRGLSDQINNDYFKNAYSKYSRQILTSGASETVPDASEFALQLKYFLRGNNKPIIDPLMMFNDIRTGMGKTTPMFGTIAGAGHQEGASFLFFKKVKEEKSTVVKIKSGIDGMTAVINGSFWGVLGKDTEINDIKSGEHQIEAYIENQWYYKGKFQVRDGESKDVIITPEKVGGLSIDVEKKYTALIKGPSGYTETVTNNKDLNNLKLGKYTIEIFEKNMEPLSETINIEFGSIAKFTTSKKMKVSKEIIGKELLEKVAKINENEKDISIIPKNLKLVGDYKKEAESTGISSVIDAVVLKHTLIENSLIKEITISADKLVESVIINKKFADTVSMLKKYEDILNFFKLQKESEQIVKKQIQVIRTEYLSIIESISPNVKKIEEYDTIFNTLNNIKQKASQEKIDDIVQIVNQKENSVKTGIVSLIGTNIEQIKKDVESMNKFDTSTVALNTLFDKASQYKLDATIQEITSISNFIKSKKIEYETNGLNILSGINKKIDISINDVENNKKTVSDIESSLHNSQSVFHELPKAIESTKNRLNIIQNMVIAKDNIDKSKTYRAGKIAGGTVLLSLGLISGGLIGAFGYLQSDYTTKYNTGYDEYINFGTGSIDAIKENANTANAMYGATIAMIGTASLSAILSIIVYATLGTESKYQKDFNNFQNKLNMLSAEIGYKDESLSVGLGIKF